MKILKKTCKEFGKLFNDKLNLSDTNFLDTWNKDYSKDLNKIINERIAKERAIRLLFDIDMYKDYTYTKLNNLCKEVIESEANT